jgi:alcohol dehydrogenase class IV
MSYEFSMPTHVVFGRYAARRTSEEITKSGIKTPKSVLIVTTRESWNAGTVGMIGETLRASGSELVEVFDSVVPNPDKHCVRKCVLMCRKLHSDAVVALGGGSTIDVAKSAVNEARIGFLVAIPTTAGTGSEISPWAVIADSEKRTKVSKIRKAPDLAILDPMLTITMPPRLTFYSGLDAFTHALESYVSKSANALTDALALHAIRLIVKNLNAAVEDGNDVNARSNMLEGSLLAGMAMLYAGLGLVHAIANTVGGMYHDLPHGLIISRIIEDVIRYNGEAISKNKYQYIEKHIEEMLSIICARIFSDLNLPEVEVLEEDVEIIVARSMENVNAATNPREISHRAVEGIIRRSFNLLSA